MSDVPGRPLAGVRPGLDLDGVCCDVHFGRPESYGQCDAYSLDDVATVPDADMFSEPWSSGPAPPKAAGRAGSAGWLAEVLRR